MLVVEVLVYVTLAASLIIPLIASLGHERSKAILAVSWTGVLSFTLASLIMLSSGKPVEFYSGLVSHDSFTTLILVGASLSAILALAAVSSDAYKWPSHPAFYSLTLLILFGVFYLAGARNILLVAASWLLVSVASYVTIALPGDRDSRFAAVRYVYVGAAATLLIALWLSAHVYASGGGLEATHFQALPRDPIVSVALTAALAAFGFKLGIFPFHWWLPSVYGKADGRPVAVVAGIAKLGFIGLTVRLLVDSFSGSQETGLILAVLSVLTMTYGNVAALTATDLQRLLAYSSIAHVGYILAAMAVAVSTSESQLFKLALAGIALQSIAYTTAKTPLFSAVADAGRDFEKELKGLLAGDRAASISIAILLASLLGIPPLIGFWGKLYMFIPLAKYSLILLAIALVNSGVSSAYYIRALRNITASPGEAPSRLHDTYRFSVILGAFTAIILGFIAPLVLILFP